MSVVALCVACVSMVLREAWPTSTETLTLGMAIVCIYGTLSVASRNIRVIAAAAWLVTMAGFAAVMVPPQVWLDFKTFVDGAELLFAQHQSPYRNDGTTAFPFPTFMLVRAISLNGRLSFEVTAWLFFFLQASLLALSYVMLRGVIAQEKWRSPFDLPIMLVQVGLLLHPAVLLALYYGQSSILASTFLIAAVWGWRCRTGVQWQHVSAICLNLAWMVKPQLLMAVGYFLASWLRRRTWSHHSDRRDEAIGRLLAPWCIVLLGGSLVVGFPGHVIAYRDFIEVASRWHSYIAEISPNNYALPAIVAKAGLRFAELPVSETLPLLTLLVTMFVVTWNVLSLRRAFPDSLLAYLPWLLASLLWTSLVWRFYLSLVIASLLLLVACEMDSSASMLRWRTLWLAAAIGLTTVLSSFVFMLGVLLLYTLSQELLANPTESAQPKFSLTSPSLQNCSPVVSFGHHSGVNQ